MKYTRKELKEAFSYYKDRVLVESGPCGHKDVLPYMQMAQAAVAKALDELDRQDRERRDTIDFFKQEIRLCEDAPALNGCEMTEDWLESIKMSQIVVDLLEEEEHE